VVQFWGNESEKREGLFFVLSVMNVCKDETQSVVSAVINGGHAENCV